LKRRCYGNRLILGPFCRRQNWLSLLFALEFRNKMQHRFVNARIISCGNASTLYEILVKISAVTLEFKRGKLKMCHNSAAIWPSMFIWHADVLKQISQFWFQLVNQQSFLYILWKFGEIRISDPGVLDVRICTVGVENFTGVTSATFTMGGAARQAHNQL